MAGVNWADKTECHWSRLPIETDVSGDINQVLIAKVYRLTEERISRQGLLRLLRSVALANQSYQLVKRRAATLKDAKRQLKAMLKMDELQMSEAITRCDSGTLALINKAQNDMDMNLETKWISCDDPYEIPGIQIPASVSVRRSIQIALDCIGPVRRGPKGTPHQRDLVRTCLAVWDEYLSKHDLPARTPGRLALVQAAFEAAGMVLGDKRIEELMANNARRGGKKRSN